jgi:carbonic anhydrase/acetyltransferase-like protein (isoleucine patch superfamily)
MVRPGSRLVTGIIACFFYCLIPHIADAQNKDQHDIHPTADIHPSVILDGHITVGAYTRIDAGTVLTGNVTIGHHTLIRCNVTVRGNVKIGNYTHIYDNVCIEGGRPAKLWSTINEERDQAIIGDFCWINHGATMHGTQMGDRSAVNLNTACDYNTRLGEGAVLANGSATHINQVIPANAFAEGVPAVVKKENITDKDREEYFGLVPEKWARSSGDWWESQVREKGK